MKRNSSFREKGTRVALFTAAMTLALAAAFSWGLAQQPAPAQSFVESANFPDFGRLEFTYQMTATGKDLGVPLYPGATLERSFALLARDSRGNTVGRLAQAFLTTTDSADKVIAFYRPRLGKRVRIDSPPQCRETLLYTDSLEETTTVRIVCGANAGENRIEISRAQLSQEALLQFPSAPGFQPGALALPKDRAE